MKMYRIELKFGPAAALVLCALFVPAACTRQTAESVSYGTGAEKITVRTPDSIFVKSLPAGFSLPEKGDELGRRILEDYGAVFVSRGGAGPPPVLIFTDEAQTRGWQDTLSTRTETFGGIEVTLQAPAMQTLLEARAEARRSGADITPRGMDAARRRYDETVALWQSRVEPALNHWVSEGGLSADTAERIRRMPLREQAAEVLRLEKQGFYFSTDFSKSILYSVAAPGTSQHLSLLAFDIREHDNARVRELLARHGWFQTVVSDTPHFTFLGVAEDELPALGLKKVGSGGRSFWVPDIR